MALAVFVPGQYSSAFGLLGCMAGEVAAAFGRAGAEVNPDRGIRPGEPRVYVFFNFPADVRTFLAWCRPDIPGAVLLHVFVDHPFALATEVMDALVAIPCYRMLLPCMDDRHLLSLRWPGLRTVTLHHAIEDRRESVVPHDQRGYDVVLSGSVATAAEVDAAAERMPSPVRGAAREMVELMSTEPATSFVRAFDLCMPSGLTSGDPWGLMRVVWSYVVPAVNRRRRFGIARSMQGLRTRVLGSAAWQEVCGGTIEYGGNIAYEAMVGELRSARVCVAWNPTQFVVTHSERVLLSMSAGCATVTDDRPALRRAFGGCVPAELVATGRMDQEYREGVDRLLSTPGRCEEIGLAGFETVHRTQTWEQRTPVFASVIESVLTGAREAASRGTH